MILASIRTGKLVRTERGIVHEKAGNVVHIPEAWERNSPVEVIIPDDVFSYESMLAWAQQATPDMVLAEQVGTVRGCLVESYMSDLIGNPVAWGYSRGATTSDVGKVYLTSNEVVRNLVYTFDAAIRSAPGLVMNGSDVVAFLEASKPLFPVS